MFASPVSATTERASVHAAPTLRTYTRADGTRSPTPSTTLTVNVAGGGSGRAMVGAYGSGG